MKTTEIRTKFPKFFERLESDPYKTFCDAATGRIYSFGFSDQGRDDFRGPFAIVLDGLGILGYWNKTGPCGINSDCNRELANEIRPTLDSLLKKFLRENRPISKSNASAWREILLTFNWGLNTHPVLETCFCAEWRSILSEIMSIEDYFGLRSAFQDVMPKIAYKDSSIQHWCVSEIKRRPWQNKNILTDLLRFLPGFRTEASSLLPIIIMGHRRLLAYSAKRIVRERAKVARKEKRFYSVSRHIQDKNEILGRELFWWMVGIEGLAHRDMNKSQIEEFKAKVDLLMVETSARCPFPPLR